MDGGRQEEAISVRRMQTGSKEWFEAVVNRYMKDAYFIALGLVGNADDAMELSQEAFYRAYCNIRHLKDEGKFYPWFYQILRNLCFSYLRKRKNRRVVSLDSCDGWVCSEHEVGGFDPAVVAQRNEAKELIWEAIGKLDGKHREVIILRHFRHLSYNEMAEVLLCSKGTVMSRLYHARRKLKQILDKLKGGQYDGLPGV